MSIGVEIVVAGVVLLIAFFAGLAITGYSVAAGVNRSNQEFYSRREDADRMKIAQLEAKVQLLEARIEDLTQRLMSPKDMGLAQ